MATKREELENPIGCLAKAADDEPIFILRGQDQLADTVVDYWASLARGAGVDMARVTEARNLADAMRAWPKRKIPD